MKKINYPKLLLSIAIAEGVGLLSALLSRGQREFYSSLVRPPLSPPGWLFPIVWVLLYAMMGAAFYFVKTSARGSYSDHRSAVIYYIFQLAVNFSWSIVFFRFEALLAAAVVIILLDLLVIITMMQFRLINKLSFWLMIPYLIWILFATYLNIGIVLLN